MKVEIYRRITRTITAITKTHVLCVFIITILMGLPKFTYGNRAQQLELPSYTAIMSDLHCYKCGAWEHEPDFDRNLKACLRNPSSIEYCPGELNGIKLMPNCAVTKQTSAGHITSFTRGCNSLINCTAIDDCEREEWKRSGICKNCCGSSLCNSVQQRTPCSLVLTVVVLLTTIVCIRLLRR